KNFWKDNLPQNDFPDIDRMDLDFAINRATVAMAAARDPIEWYNRYQERERFLQQRRGLGPLSMQ
ncbi:MAG: hypothetical protein ACREHG_03830, partial [Candidatus Saccharimonadales bacterium]